MKDTRLKLSHFIEELYNNLAPFNTSAVKCTITLAEFDFDLEDIEMKYGKDIFYIPPVLIRRDAHEKIEFEINISYMRGCKFKENK